MNSYLRRASSLQSAVHPNPRAEDVRTIARGEHLHVDDLVVTAAARGRGIGAALLSTIEAAARADGCRSVFLDSRPEVLGFYATAGYAPHTAVLVRKPL